MLAAYVIFLLTAFGMGAWFVGLSLGLTHAAGTFLAVIVLFVLTTFLGVGVAAAAWAVLIAALLGLGVAAYRLRHRRVTVADALHPACLMSLVTGAVIAAAAPDGPYVPHAWDEMSGWVTWMKQILAADVWYSDEMMDGFPHYPKGWPLIAVYPQVFQTGFDGVRAIAVAAVMHTAMLGALYDLFRSLPAVQRLPNTTAVIAGWGTLLVLLLVEATWILVPGSLEVERPILYGVVATVIIGFMASREAEPPRAVWAAFAVALAATISFKTSMAAMFAPAAVFALASPGSWSIRLRRLVVVLAPAVALVFAWSQVGTAPLPSGSGQPVVGVVETILGVSEAALRYALAYKTPVFAVALLGLVWIAVAERGLWLLLFAGIAFALTYHIGLIMLYVFAMGIDTSGLYPSLERYVRLPIRLLHVFGGLVFIYAVLRTVTGRWPAIADNIVAKGAGGVAAAVLAVWIYNGAGTIVADLDRKRFEDQLNVTRILQVRDEAGALHGLIAAEELKTPTIVIITQGDFGYWHNVAGFYSVRDGRDGPVQVFRHSPTFSWGATSEDVWMRSATVEEMRDYFRSFPILWPIVIDAWIAPILGSLADTPACADAPTDHFFVRDPAAPSGFRCLLKASLPVSFQ